MHAWGDSNDLWLGRETHPYLTDYIYSWENCGKQLWHGPEWFLPWDLQPWDLQPIYKSLEHHPSAHLESLASNQQHMSRLRVLQMIMSQKILTFPLLAQMDILGRPMWKQIENGLWPTAGNLGTEENLKGNDYANNNVHQPRGRSLLNSLRPRPVPLLQPLKRLRQMTQLSSVRYLTHRN